MFVDLDAIEVGRSGLGPDAGPSLVVGPGPPHPRRACRSSGSPKTRTCSVHGKRPQVVPRRQCRSKGSLVFSDKQHRDAPAVGLGDNPGRRRPRHHPGSRAGSPTTRVATNPKVIGTWLSAASVCIRPSDRRRSSGSGEDMPASAPSKMPRPEFAHHADQLRRPRPRTPTARPRAGCRTSRGARCARSRSRWRPPRMDSASWPFMAARSSSVASYSKARSPMAHVRRAECPMLAAKLMPLGRRSTASRY